MLTIGLAKEMFFVAHVLGDSFYFKIFKGEKQDNEMCVKMTPEGRMTVWYQGKEIWQEVIDGPESFFGIESCDTIARIVACIDNGTSWDQYRWKEKS
jgi:hypothetical protein